MLVTKDLHLGKQHPKIFRFGGSQTEGSAALKSVLGNKGANLAEMCRLGLPVPPGFTIPTSESHVYQAKPQKLSAELKAAVLDGLKFVEDQVGFGFGHPLRPLLVSVRSGAPVSMPGMMDTLLNLGLCESTLPGLLKTFDTPRFVYDAYRRLIHMFGTVVLNLPHPPFEELLSELKTAKKCVSDTALDAASLKDLSEQYLELIRQEGKAFPQDPYEQLWAAIEAVFQSWNNPRALSYRKLSGISHDLGTAVTVQAMVFGNLGTKSATGVCFSRNPATGKREVFGEYLENAQGEDVVAGLRTPKPLSKHLDYVGQSLEETMPAVYTQLTQLLARLEKHALEMQDVEFTVQNGTLYLLQTRSGKRSGAAAIQIAVDLVNEGLITPEQAIHRVECEHVEQLLHPQIDPKASRDVLARGLAASPGVGSGQIVFTPQKAKALAEAGQSVILVRQETSPDDIEGMAVAKGILTATGGMTSHAAVVARGMGKCCVCGVTDLHIEPDLHACTLGHLKLVEGDWISLDGGRGEVLRGKVPTVHPSLEESFFTFMQWVDRHRTLRIRANADTPEDAQKARTWGAEGIGLTRTEHMFFREDRILHMQALILKPDRSTTQNALQKLKAFQTQDFIDILRCMTPYPVTIRLLDPPLHEFIPKTPKDIARLAKSLGIPPNRIEEQVHRLEEANPMLGHRGVRLGITRPEIYEMQTAAILEAALWLKHHENLDTHPEIMIPLVFGQEETLAIQQRLEKTIHALFDDHGVRIPYAIGTMIETPGACLSAPKIAQHVDFLSFGTNDLTQLTLGISRDDCMHFVPAYLEQGLLARDPFRTLDMERVGALMKLAVEGAKTQPKRLKIGLCGEHGGDPTSVAFCARLGLDYVSCSPFRLAVARLAAAQARSQR
jgi:pyruvate,orthophosphate dikinase